MNMYDEYVQKLQEEWNALPVFYAIAMDESGLTRKLQEVLVKRGLNASQINEVCSLGDGCFCLKGDVALLKEYSERNRNKLADAMQEPGFAYQAFYAELVNNEFCFTEDESDALDALKLTSTEVEDNPMLKRSLAKAKKKIAGSRSIPEMV